MTRRNNDLSSEELSIVFKNPKSNDALSFKESMDLFLKDCEIRNLRSHTIRYYRNELTYFYNLLVEQDIDTTPKNITLNIIKNNIILYMKDVKKSKVVTINTRLRAIRTFFNFLHREKYIKKNPVKGLKLLRERKKAVETFTDDELKELFKQPNLKTFTGVRDYTIMMLLLETGIRANECANISISDVRFKDSVILIRNAKGQSERFVPITKRMKEQLQKWLQIRGLQETDALWTNIDAQPLQKRQLQNRITKYGKMVGVHATCHKFRHTFARMSVLRGAGIFELQAVLGHSTLEMVKTYVNLFGEEVKEKHKGFSPLNNLDI